MINYEVKMAFVDNADRDVQSGIAVSEYIRNETLSRAYATSGYIDMPTDERNKIYDEIRNEIICELTAMGISV